MPGIASAATSVVDRARRRRHVDASAWARAASCSPTTRRWSSPSSSARSTRSTPGGSTSGSGARPGQTRPPRTPSAARSWATSTASPRTSSSCSAYFGEPAPGQRVRAFPGAGADVPVWILGSSLFGAELAAALGPSLRVRLALRARAADGGAVDVYRRELPPCGPPRLPRGSCSGSTSSSRRQRRRGDAPASPRSSRRSSTCAAAGRTRLPPPLPGYAQSLAPQYARELLDGVLSCAVVGAPDTVRAAARGAGRAHRADELIVTSGQIHDHRARLRSYALLAEVRDQLAEGRAVATDGALRS